MNRYVVARFIPGTRIVASGRTMQQSVIPPWTFPAAYHPTCLGEVVVVEAINALFFSLSSLEPRLDGHCREFFAMVQEMLSLAQVTFTSVC